MIVYASECGGVGLDTDYMLSQFEVLAQTRPISIADMNTEDAVSFMNKGDPWQPEAVYYIVARISRGINNNLHNANKGDPWQPEAVYYIIVARISRGINNNLHNAPPFFDLEKHPLK